MFRALVLGTILGGLTAFAWCFVSLKIIERHRDTPAVVTKTVREGPFEITLKGKPIQQPPAVQALAFMGMAFVFTWLLLHTAGLSYAKRVTFITIAGLILPILGAFRTWNSGEKLSMLVLISLLNCGVMWLLAGLVIAKVTTVRAVQEQPLMRTP